MSPEKIKPFSSSLAPIISNLGNGRVCMKLNNPISVQQTPSSLYSTFIFKLYIGAVKLTRNAIKSTFICNGPVTSFDGADRVVVIILLEMF